VPLIARGLVLRACARNAAALSYTILADDREHGLALSKDFAVSLPLCSPYGGIGPSSSGWGPLNRFRSIKRAFALRRHCSHLCSCEWRLLAATFLSFYATLSLYTRRECPDFPLRGEPFEGRTAQQPSGSTSYVDGIAFGTRTRRVGVRQEPLCCGFATAGAEGRRTSR
jgi:hypothetical protein